MSALIGEYSVLENGERRLCLGHQQRDSQELEGDVAEEGKGISICLAELARLKFFELSNCRLG